MWTYYLGADLHLHALMDGMTVDVAQCILFFLYEC